MHKPHVLPLRHSIQRIRTQSTRQVQDRPEASQRTRPSYVSRFTAFVSFAAVLVAIISMAVSWYFSRRSAAHAEQALRNESGTSHIDMLLELNKLLVERPELWSLYDGFLLPEEARKDPLLEPRKEALMYYYMNMFERVSNYYTHIAPQTDANKLYAGAWDRFLHGWLRDSAKARQIARRGLTRDVYPTHFAERLSKALKQAEDPVPILIDNVRVHGHPAANAVLLAEGRIRSIGGTRELATDAATFDRYIRIDGEQGWLIPGLHDAHSHLLKGAIEHLGVDLTRSESIAAVQDSVAHATMSKGHSEWIVGRGWRYDIALPESYPTAAQLDEVSQDHPIVLTSYDGHAMWLNSRAMAMVGISESTPDPYGGRIVRTSDGRPTGILLEGAMEIARSAIPAPTRPEQLAVLRQALRDHVAKGVTSIDVIDRDSQLFTLLDELESAKELPVRVRVCLPLLGDIEQYKAIRRRYVSPKLEFGFLKGYVDGVIESETALMLKPYEGTSSSGQPVIDPDRLLKAVRRAHRDGFQVALHCIGDGAVRLALDTYEEVQKEQSSRPLSHRIEHIEVISPGDAYRFGKLGVIASMQPIHADPRGDSPNSGVWASKLGAARLRYSFPWRTLLDSGATLAFGSDWPVAPYDPLQGIAVAITRQDELGRPSGGWNAHQAITTAESLVAYSRPSAIDASSHGREPISEGSDADLVLLSAHVDFENPQSLWSGERIRSVIVLGTIQYPLD